MEKNKQKKVKIVCTIGPASESPEMLEKLAAAGMDIMRCNFSHGSHEEHGKKYKAIDELNKKTGRKIEKMLDTKGPDIRFKNFVNGEAFIKKGDKFSLYTDDREGNQKGASITHKDLTKYVSKGNVVLIGDGLVSLIIESVKPNEIVTVVENGGRVASKKSVFVQAVDVHLPFLSQNDIDDLKFGLTQKVDMIGASCVNKAEDVLEMRKIVGKLPIISKIETRQGMKNLDEIIKVSDGIMIARGGLGTDYPLEQIPTLQKIILKKCNEANKFVITATEMLESMIKNPRPTRAETNDVANAVYDGTSGVMMSAETAVGDFPVETVTYMKKLVDEALSQMAKKK